MAYQMIHMEVAYRLLKIWNQVRDPAEFILGSVAPDSVHMAKDYAENGAIPRIMKDGTATFWISGRNLEKEPKPQRSRLLSWGCAYTALPIITMI